MTSALQKRAPAVASSTEAVTTQYGVSAHTLHKSCGDDLHTDSGATQLVSSASVPTSQDIKQPIGEDSDSLIQELSKEW